MGIYKYNYRIQSLFDSSFLRASHQGDIWK